MIAPENVHAAELALCVIDSVEMPVCACWSVILKDNSFDFARLVKCSLTVMQIVPVHPSPSTQEP